MAVVVLEDRHRVARRRVRAVGVGTRIEAVPSLEDVPSVVQAADARGLHVDLLPGVLADVGGVELAGRAIEAEAPRIAEPV